jgi:hypothetical protein
MTSDIIFVGPENDQWKKLKEKYPTAKRADDFAKAQNKSMTKMFWVVWNDINVCDNFDFSLQPDEWSKEYVHVFKNGEYYDGIVLCPKRIKLNRRELEYRFFIKKKEVDEIASRPKPFDIVFISYKESNADENYERLLKIAPRAKRVHGVKGIHQAHIEAANLCDTEMFWVVDGDAEIVDDFNFDYQVPRWEHDCVHVWRSKNPVNDLTYGYGGVKLLPSELTKRVDVESADMTTSISNKFKAVEEVSNVTRFDTDEFSTWRSAFRECAKLASKNIRGQIDEETEARLETWCSRSNGNSLYGRFARAGAIHGREFGLSIESSVQLGKINDYDWLYARFLEDNSAAS